jgi:hypothetical protein
MMRTVLQTRTPEALRQAMVGRLGEEAVQDRVWDFLVAEGHVAAVQHGERDLNWLVERIENFLQASGLWERVYRPRLPMVAREARVGDHMVVRSRLLGRRAAAREDVQKFRKDVLAGRLLHADKVEGWILERTPRTGLEGLILEVEAPAEGILDLEAPGRLRSPLTVRELVGMKRQFVDYATPTATHVKRMPTAAKGPLAWLRHLSEQLAKSYHWQPAQATLFVLTGQVPLVSSLRWSVKASDEAGARLELNLDPLLSPKQLSAKYARLRKRLVGTRARVRQLSEKHLTLANFVADRPADEAWAKRLRTWNAEYPRWKYRHESNFRRDAARATARILAPTVSFAATLGAMWSDEETAESKKSAPPSTRPSPNRTGGRR